MLKFQRNKLVSIFQDKPDELRVHGLLDDHIFGLEIDITIKLDDLSIVSIQGKWNREETPECSRALPFLEAAMGFKIDNKTLSQEINKVVSRKACPHFANLLLECCLTARDAIHVIQWRAAQSDQTDLSFKDHLAGDGTADKEQQPVVAEDPAPHKGDKRISISESPRKREKKDGGDFYIDLHTHSFPASQCSTADVHDLIREAQRIGLDAICLTDHNHVWRSDDIEDLRQKHGFHVLRGNEITTDQGDMLVFGMHRDVNGIINQVELKQMVDDAGGFMIAAHPFRGFLVFNTSQIGMTVEKAMQRPAFQQVHALETLNGKVTKQENTFAAKVAAGMKLPATGGSDAHAVSDVGKYVTCFHQSIETEPALVAALQKCDFKPFQYRQRMTQGEQNAG